MRLMGIAALLLLLAVGLAMSYFMYRQLDTGIVTLEAAPQFVRNEQGSLCADVDLAIEARTLGRWLLLVEDGQDFAGVATVHGNKDSDIGLRILSPSNRLVMFEPERRHQHEFAVAPAIRGAYTFELDNRHSMLRQKQVTISVCLT